jgi:hypothetical protein
MKELVLRLAEKDKHALGDVRCFPGLKAAADGGVVWVRGIPSGDKTPVELRMLPATATFFLGENDLLFPPGALTPAEKLNPLDWLPLAEFLPVTLPVSPLPGKTNARYAARLAPSGRNEEPTALLTSFSAWKQFAEKAPLVRLLPLRFARSENDDVLITGAPLPPLPGKALWQQGNLLLPCGFDFDPPVVAQLVRDATGTQHDSVVLFAADGSSQEIFGDAFVPATRSAVRLTAERSGHE